VGQQKGEQKTLSFFHYNPFSLNFL